MGGGSWDVGDYTRRVTKKKAAGIPTFDHTAQIQSGQKAIGVHELLDPLSVNKNGPHAGKNIREAMISDEHPNPTAIAVLLDVTGSNIRAAEVAHSKMPNLHGLLQRKGYVEDPQILFGAIGDAYSDDVPLQMGQFESDNRMDEQLESIYLEGNGGGQVHESYEVGALFLARCTYLETYEKYGKKGYVFFIGDEMPYDIVRRSYPYSKHTLESLTGLKLEADISTEEVFKELQERYEVFFLFQVQGTYRAEDILPAWRKLLGERVLLLDDPATVCETIAVQLGLCEGTIDDVDQGIDDLLALGVDPSVANSVGKTLAKATSRPGGGIAKTKGNLPKPTDQGGSTRI